MCGIVGLVDWGDDQILERMVEVQTHRGPDDHGLESLRARAGNWIGLGSRRLAILDLSPSGHMPMWDQDRGTCVVFNGEIYNFQQLRQQLVAKGHTFRSRGDTEVLLHLYREEGPEFVKRLNGMFALALWDRDRQQLVVARDHFGIKPLYYAYEQGRFACASELKALLLLPGIKTEIDAESLHQYLTFLWVPEPCTMLRGIEKLPAGHYAIMRGGQLTVTKYWDLEFPHRDTRYAATEAELVDQVRERFTAAVKSQLVSDRPVGAFLSAGLDSSSIVAAAAKVVDRPLKTYTITFPKSYRVGESTLDDPRVAARLAQRFGCDHHEIVVEPQVTSLLPKLIWHMDEPIADPALITSYAVCHAAAASSTVLLSGIGGDELFAGYRKHCAHYWAKAYRLLPRFMRNGLIAPIVNRLPTGRGSRFKGIARLAKKMVRSGSLSERDRFLMDSTYLDDDQKRGLYSDDFVERTNGLDAWGRHKANLEPVRDADFLHQMLYLDSKLFMTSLNLNYNDKMSMASSVEVRVPFLDRELAEFVAASVPPRMKLNGFWRPTTKYILRKAMADVLPAEVLNQPKAGFGAPVDYWLANDLGEMTDDLLSDRAVRQRGYFNPATVRQFVDEHRAGRQDWSMQIWQLLTLELWMQEFVDHPNTRTQHDRRESPVAII